MLKLIAVLILALILSLSPCFAAEKPRGDVPEVSKAAKVVQEERQKCLQELEVVLKKYGFNLAVSPEIVINGQKAGIVLVPVQ